MSSIITELFDVLVAIAMVFVLSHLLDRPATEISIAAILGYVVIINSRTRSK